MGKIFELLKSELDGINKAYTWMEEERLKNREGVFKKTYSTITDFYIDLDTHISYFYDTKNEKLFARTFFHTSGLITYEEIMNPERLVNESDESRTIAWVLLRTGYYLANR